MVRSRPKLLILAGSSVSAAEVERGLHDRFEVVETDAATACSKLRSGEADLVLTDPAHLAPLQAQLGTHHSNVLLEAIGDGVCLARSDGQSTWSNARFSGLEESVRQRVRVACQEASRWFNEHGAVPGELDPGTATCRFDVASGDGDRFYEVTITPADDAHEDGGDVAALAQHAEGGPRVRQVAVIVRDVTRQHRTQLKLDAIDRAGAELVRLDSEAVRRMNAVERLRLLERKLLKNSKDILRFDHVIVRLLDEQTGRLELVMCSDLPPEARELEIVASVKGNGTCGYVAATGRSYICRDTERDERFLPGIKGARSSLTVPIRLHDKVIGVMDFESEKLGAFTDEDRQFSQIFARYMAMALNMLDMLVVERSTTNRTVSTRFEGELNEPLQDILHEVDWLTTIAGKDPEYRGHVSRIRADVESIRRRLHEAAAGPASLLGLERAMSVREADPAFVDRRVLVADDEPNVRRIIHDVLHNRGATVVTCATGQEAIDALNASGDEGFDLLISDIKLPDRNGYEVFAAARARSASTPVILMTGFGYDPHHSIVRASQEGLQSVLFKPFQVDRLLDEARKALKAGGSEA